MTLRGRIFMWLFIFTLGALAGAQFSAKTVEKNLGEMVKIRIDGKVKKGANVNVNVEKESNQASKRRLFGHKRNN